MKDRSAKDQPDSSNPSRRRFLKSGAVLAGVLGACADSGNVSDSGPRTLGAIPSPYGQRSTYEKSVRYTNLSDTPEAGASRTPLQDSYGILTPSSLHFERHHSGVPTIDPPQHHLLIHGMVDRPLVFSMEEILRLPSVSRIHFIECSGNSGREWTTPEPTVQRTHGMLGCSEWTGVSLSLLLSEGGCPKRSQVDHRRGGRRLQAAPKHPHGKGPGQYRRRLRSKR